MVSLSNSYKTQILLVKNEEDAARAYFVLEDLPEIEMLPTPKGLQFSALVDEVVVSDANLLYTLSDKTGTLRFTSHGVKIDEGDWNQVYLESEIRIYRGYKDEELAYIASQTSKATGLSKEKVSYIEGKVYFPIPQDNPGFSVEDIIQNFEDHLHKFSVERVKLTPVTTGKGDFWYLGQWYVVMPKTHVYSSGLGKTSWQDNYNSE